MKKIIKFLNAACVTLAVIWLMAGLIACGVVAFVVSDITTKLIIVGLIFMLGGGLGAVGIIFFGNEKPERENKDNE